MGQWRKDAELVTHNCRIYNRPETDYFQCANKVDVFIASKLPILLGGALGGVGAGLGSIGIGGVAAGRRRR